MDPLQVLGLGPTASLDDAEEAYYQLLRKHHPDLHQGGTPQQIAEAEQRTRELNAAIELIRRHAGVGARTAGVGATGEPQPTGWRQGDDPADTWGTWWGTDDRAAWSRADMRPTVHCPTCGIELTNPVEFRVHMETAHEMRLGRRARRRRAKARSRHRTSASLWALAPGNLLVALAVGGAAEMMVHDQQLAVWAFLVTMSPTLIRLVNGR